MMKSQKPNYSSVDSTPVPVDTGTDLVIMNHQAKINSTPSFGDESISDGYQNEGLRNVVIAPGGEDDQNRKVFTENNGRGTSEPDSGSGCLSSFSNWITSSEIYPVVYKLFVFLLLPVWIWLTLYVLVGRDALPHGSVFVLILLACGGRILGFLLETIHLPPMIGMLGLGLVLRNVPYIDFGKDLDLVWSAPIRQTALAVILTRAGLGLDSKILLAFKAVILRLAFFPTVLEAVSIAVLAYFVLDTPWVWGLLLGCVLAPVSPAVVVPRLLELKQAGFGMSKGIPTIIIASASLDNVIAISFFGVVLNFAVPEGSLTFSILQGPLQVLIGLAYGIGWGFILGMIFNAKQREDTNVMAVRLLFTFGGGIVSVIGLSKLGFSGAGALGCLLSAFTAASIWRAREVTDHPDPLAKIFLLLWFVFEPLLFGVIGCQIDILSLTPNTILLGLVCICGGLLVRVATVFLMVSKTNLNTREKLFAAIAWVPKATVQVAIGPIALDKVRSRNEGHEAEKYAENILILAVLTILLTAPIGELGVMFTGRRFLAKN